MIPNQCIIIGGGSSLTSALNLSSDLSLQDRLATKFVISTNYSFLHFPSTFLAFTDRDFYSPHPKPKGKETNPNYYQQLKELSLIVGLDSEDMQVIKHPNTILLKSANSYQREHCLDKGFYCSFLTGIVALSIASYLMKYKGIIWLLGFDWGGIKTHYYDNIKHRGIGNSKLYNAHNPHNYFKCFLEPNLKIYNVSLNSNIQTFEKISYERFYQLLSKDVVNQDILREEIRRCLTK